MIIDKVYKVLIIKTQVVEKFVTTLTEENFYKTLDSVYGNSGYKILEVIDNMSNNERGTNDEYIADREI